MIGQIKTGTLKRATISGVSFEGLSVTGPDGTPAKLAIIDQHGAIIEAGEDVAREAWNVAIASYKNFLIGEGHLRIYSAPPGFDEKAAA